MHSNIPNIVHFCFGLRPQLQEFLFVYYVAVLSAYLVNKPDCIRFIYHHEPHGPWWDKLKQIPGVELIRVDVPEMIGPHKIKHVAHKADKLRMDFLYFSGGVYFDIDTICVRPYEHLLNNDVVLGKEFPDGICNAIMFTSPRSRFFKLWCNEYAEHFKPDGWREASILLPEQIWKREPQWATVLSPECFFLPHCHETHNIFSTDQDIPEQLITLHLWEKFSMKYIEHIHDWSWAKNNINTLYGKLLDNIHKLQHDT